MLRSLIMVPLAGLFACLHVGPLRAESPVKIGVILPLSGDFAVFGEQARAEIMKTGTAQVQYIFEDDRCEPSGAITAFSKLTTVDGVRLILGPGCGSPQKAVAGLLKKSGVVGMAFSSAPATLKAESGGQFFSSQTPIESEARFVADQVNERGLKKAVVVYNDNEFSRAHEEAFKKYFKGEVKEVIRFGGLDTGQAVSAALKLRLLRPDVVFVPDAAPFLLGLMSSAKRLGIKNVQFFSVYSAEMPGVLTAEKGAAEGLLYSYPKIGDSQAMDYFPRKAAEMLTQAAVACQGDSACAKEELLKRNQFDQDNALKNEMILKTVRNGKFSVLNN